jgi:PAS domain S-box-containing protein
MAAGRRGEGSLAVRDVLFRGFTAVPAKRVLKVLVPLTVVFVLAFWVEYRRQVESDETQLLAREAAAIRAAAGDIERELTIATGDLQLGAALDAHFLAPIDPDEVIAGVRRMVVDPDGGWMRDGREGEPAVATGNGRSFERVFPGVLPGLLSSPRVWVESGEGFFQQIPLTLPAAASGADLTLVSFVPSPLLGDIAVRRATTLLLVAVPLYYALVAVGWLVAAALERRDEELRNHEEARNAMMSSALDGIVAMDEAGVTLEFNRSAQRIFGYAPDEVRGRLVADLIIPPDQREPHRTGLKRYLATGEKRIVDKHIDRLTAIRKDGEEFPVELTVCHPVRVGGKRVFYGFLRDLSESGGGRAEERASCAPPVDLP